MTAAANVPRMRAMREFSVSRLIFIQQSTSGEPVLHAEGGRVSFPAVHLFSIGRIDVAQVSNLLYRSASSLRRLKNVNAVREIVVLPIGDRRYSGLETLETGAT